MNFLVCVCALCLQAPDVPPSAELSALFLTSGTFVGSSGGGGGGGGVCSHTGTITPIDHGGSGTKKRESKGEEGEDIKGVCHTHAPARTRSSFVFI